MAKQPDSGILSGVLILSVLAAVLILVSDFAWGYYYLYGNYYPNRYDYFSIWEPWWGVLVLGPILALFVFNALVAYEGIQKKPTFTSKRVRQAYRGSIAILAITIVLAIIFAIIAEANYDDWDFDVAFYAALIGGGLSALFYRITLQNIE